jgi:peptidyl-prolyl cis-trans isomerase D
MLQDIRKNLQGTIAKVIVAIIVVPFALFGIESLVGGGGVQYVAEVNGQGVSAQELQQQINQQKRRLLMNLGDRIDPSMLDDQMLAGPALDFMIRKVLLLQAAQDYGLAISDQRLGEFIAEMPVFQVDGRFSRELYQRVVSDQGYSPAGFQKALQEDLLMTQLRSGLSSSEFATSVEIDQIASIDDEQRDVRYLVLPLDGFRDNLEPGEEQVLQWFADHQQQFTSAESVELEYVELTPDIFRKPVDEERIRELYEIDKDSFELPEERRVSHILFEQGAEESAAELAARVEAAQQQLASGDRAFADVATELSEDVGSANFGGDLGFTAGETFPEEMESVIAALQLNEVSAPVQTDAGVHLVKLTEIRSGESRDFTAVRGELEVQLQNEEAALELIKTVERLRDLVFNADDLAGPATELALTVERSKAVLRNQKEGLFTDPRLIAAAFSKEVLSDRYNSEVIELDAGHFVVLRVLTHAPSAPIPLEDVREDVEQALAAELARTEIREQADELLRRLRAGSSIEELALEGDYLWQVELAARRSNQGLPPSLLRRLFQLPAPADKSSFYDYVQNSEGDIELFELVRVTAGEASRLAESQRKRLQRKISEEYGQRADAYFQQELRSRADVVRS